MLEKFEELQISEPILRALNDMGFEEPTPIQKEAIPVAMSGLDMIGQAQTGTGKTAAFGIPALEQVDENLRAVQVLILSPTRELAIQVAEELNKMAQHTHIQALLSTAVRIFSANSAACAKILKLSSQPRVV